MDVGGVTSDDEVTCSWLFFTPLLTFHFSNPFSSCVSSHLSSSVTTPLSFITLLSSLLHLLWPLLLPPFLLLLSHNGRSTGFDTTDRYAIRPLGQIWLQHVCLCVRRVKSKQRFTSGDSVSLNKTAFSVYLVLCVLILSHCTLALINANDPCRENSHLSGSLNYWRWLKRMEGR